LLTLHLRHPLLSFCILANFIQRLGSFDLTPQLPTIGTHINQIAVRKPQPGAESGVLAELLDLFEVKRHVGLCLGIVNLLANSLEQVHECLMILLIHLTILADLGA
jgi:hypothetical protein